MYEWTRRKSLVNWRSALCCQCPGATRREHPPALLLCLPISLYLCPSKGLALRRPCFPCPRKGQPPNLSLNPPGHHTSHFPSSAPRHELLCLHGLIPTNLLAYCHFSHLTSKQLLILLFLFQLLEATPSSLFFLAKLSERDGVTYSECSVILVQ